MLHAPMRVGHWRLSALGQVDAKTTTGRVSSDIRALSAKSRYYSSVGKCSGRTSSRLDKRNVTLTCKNPLTVILVFHFNGLSAAGQSVLAQVFQQSFRFAHEFRFPCPPKG